MNDAVPGPDPHPLRFPVRYWYKSTMVEPETDIEAFNDIGLNVRQAMPESAIGLVVAPCKSKAPKVPARVVVRDALDSRMPTGAATSVRVILVAIEAAPPYESTPPIAPTYVRFMGR